ncbi:hypothetical protein Q31b_32890 [Novipirellula aureliae]|uniref:Uncharacterized protein n=1 Tax=Novipirellula aureliae TaxID=2527966 RepID=A0A5C6DRQ0_9BACT|nr:hypothetical protein Q31b_32890 [Novipirellula aureliae]
MKLRDIVAICLVGSAVMTNSAGAKEPVCIKSLLGEMVDRDGVSCYPESDFRLKQPSSYDRRSTSPEDSEGWLRNKNSNWNDTDSNFYSNRALQKN